jgi:mono/diheme cytochrome c family protein
MAAHSLAMFNCYACHSRDGQGGPDTLRSEFFSTTGDEDLGDEGRIPPHLTGVGSKLRPEWLQQVLTRQAMVRPYMATRMPQFGESNMEHLPPLLAKADARESTRQPAAMPVQDIKYGRAMVGSTGLSCISCHNYAGYKSLGIPAMDLTQMSKRLQYDWFHRYLIEPQSLRPGTRMPSFWPEGKSMRDDLLEGDSDRQIRAIWGYLERSEDAGVPPGLIQGKMELMADTQALIYRAFINDSGTRGIGVAFPERAHFTFDANALRPALIWQGPFMDAAKHRIGRGSGFEGPLGYNVVKMPAGPPLAFLESTETPWPAETGREAGYRMRGYRLDDMARPTFQYEFQDIKVEDKTVAIPGDLEATLHRTLTMSHSNAPKNLWLRAWVAKKIKPTAPGTFVIDDRIELRLTTRGDRSTQIRKQGDAFELLVPVDFLNQQAVIVEEIVW